MYFNQQKTHSSEGLSEELSEGLNSLYKAVTNNPGIQAKDLSEVLKDRSLKTIERQVAQLIAMKLIERKGSRKTGGYHITPSSTEIL